MTSYITLISLIKNFFDNHSQVYRFESDFLEQFDNYAGFNEKFPLVYMSLISSDTTGYITTFNIKLHCVDVIQKDRKNINNIISDTQLILSDFYRYLEYEELEGIDVFGGGNTTPLNNAFCDYLAGNEMDLSIEVTAQSRCEIPYKITIDELEFPLIFDENTIFDGGANTIISWQ